MDPERKLKKRVGRAVKAHYRAASSYDFLDKAATASSVFGSVLVIVAGIYVEFLRAQLEPLRYWPGLILTAVGFVIFVLTTSQLIWRWNAKGEAHKVAASKYAAIRRKVEVSIDHGRPTNFDQISQELDLLGDASPMVPGRIWKWADRKYSKAETR